MRKSSCSYHVKPLKNEEEVLLHYRRVRDEIKAFVESLYEAL